MPLALRRVPGAGSRFEVIGLVAEDRWTGLAVDQEHLVLKTGFEGQIAAVVERKIITRGDLDEPPVQARLADRRFKPHELPRLPWECNRLFDRGDSLQRQPHPDVPRREHARIEAARRTVTGCPSRRSVRSARAASTARFRVKGRPTSTISTLHAAGNRSAGGVPTPHT